MVKYKDLADWANSNYDTMVYRSPRELAEIVWKAACEHQRDVDVEIVRNETIKVMDDMDDWYNQALQDAAAAVANQELQN